MRQRQRILVHGLGGGRAAVGQGIGDNGLMQLRESFPMQRGRSKAAVQIEPPPILRNFLVGITPLFRERFPIPYRERHLLRSQLAVWGLFRRGHPFGEPLIFHLKRFGGQFRRGNHAFSTAQRPLDNAHKAVGRPRTQLRHQLLPPVGLQLGLGRDKVLLSPILMRNHILHDLGISPGSRVQHYRGPRFDIGVPFREQLPHFRRNPCNGHRFAIRPNAQFISQFPQPLPEFVVINGVHQRPRFQHGLGFQSPPASRFARRWVKSEIRNHQVAVQENV